MAKANPGGHLLESMPIPDAVMDLSVPVRIFLQEEKQAIQIL